MGDNESTKRGPSALLLLPGLIAVAVSVWALAGPDTWAASTDNHVGWFFVVAAIVVGAVLVIAPSSKR